METKVKNSHRRGDLDVSVRLLLRQLHKVPGLELQQLEECPCGSPSVRAPSERSVGHGGGAATLELLLNQPKNLFYSFRLFFWCEGGGKAHEAATHDEKRIKTRRQKAQNRKRKKKKKTPHTIPLFHPLLFVFPPAGGLKKMLSPARIQLFMPSKMPAA